MYRNRHETQGSMNYNASKARGRRIQDKLDAQQKAEDALKFYWKKGCNHLRRTFHKTSLFNPQPEDFYNEGKYR